MTGGLIRSSHCAGHQKSQFNFFPSLNSTGQLLKDAQIERWTALDGKTRVLPAMPALGAPGSEPSSQHSRSGVKGWVTKPQLCITDIKSYVSLRKDPYKNNLYLLTVDMKKAFNGSKSENGITWQIRASCVGLSLGAGGALLRCSQATPPTISGPSWHLASLFVK